MKDSELNISNTNMSRLFKTTAKTVLLFGAVFCFNISYADVFIAARTANTDYFPTSDTGYVYTSVPDSHLNQLLIDYNVNYYFKSHKYSQDSNSWYIHMWGNENDTRALYDTLEKLGIYNEIELKEVNLANAITKEVEKIECYPNPSFGQVWFEGVNQGDEIRLFSQAGKLIKHITIDEWLQDSRIQLDGFQPGIYYAQVYCHDNSKVVSKQLIVL